jgi:hypothetical protein
MESPNAAVRSRPSAPDASAVWSSRTRRRWWPASFPLATRRTCRLFERHSIEVVVNKRGKNAFLRASFQVYNDASDIDRLSDALSSEL